MISRLELGSRPRILVIALRRLGDVLLTTPLIRSIRRAWPDAHIEALVFADTAGILAGNPDLDAIVTMPPRPSAGQTLSLARKLFRQYDLAVSTQAGDRPTGFAIVAGKARIAPVEDRFSGRLKRLFLNRSLPFAIGLHRVEDMLRLADTLGIPRVAEVVAPAPMASEYLPTGPYAVIHAAPFFRYKQWTEEGWRTLAAKLSAQGLAVVASGGPGDAERRYLDAVWQDSDVIRVDGRLSWQQLSGVLGGAQVYVGPDTSVTHLAAASGCPTVALFGPTDPRLWAPWPTRGLSEAWQATGRIQQRGNVSLVQHAFPCTPCQLEGCERRLDSDSACLQALSVEQVMDAVKRAVGG